MTLDYIDRELLMLLQADCKQTTKWYANALSLSTTAVFERIKKLERNGIISGYVAILDPARVNKGFTVFCQVRLVQHTKENVLRFEQQVKQLEEVRECHHVSGNQDYILIVDVADMEAYRDFMVNKLTAIQQIGSTQSAFVINTISKTTALTL